MAPEESPPRIAAERDRCSKTQIGCSTNVDPTKSTNAHAHSASAPGSKCGTFARAVRARDVTQSSSRARAASGSRATLRSRFKSVRAVADVDASCALDDAAMGAATMGVRSFVLALERVSAARDAARAVRLHIASRCRAMCLVLTVSKAKVLLRSRNRRLERHV